VVEHRAEIAHVEPAFMRTEIEPCQSDGHGESGFMTRGINPAAHGSMSSGRGRATALRNGIYSLTRPARTRFKPLAGIPQRIFPRGPISLIEPRLEIGLGALRQEHLPRGFKIGAGLLEGLVSVRQSWAFRPVRMVRKRVAMPDQSAPGIGRQIVLCYDPAFAHCLRPGHSNGVPSAEPPRAKFHVFTFIHPQGTKSPLVEFRHWAVGRMAGCIIC